MSTRAAFHILYTINPYYLNANIIWRNYFLFLPCGTLETWWRKSLLLAEPVTEANVGYTLFMDSEAEVIG